MAQPLFPTSRHSPRRAFTLLELIFVMTLITVAMALAAPDLRNFFAGRKVGDTASRIVSLMQWARTQAISEGRTYRITVEPTRLSVTVLDAGQFIPTGMGLARELQVEEDVELSLTRPDLPDPTCIDFDPQGRTQPAEIRVRRLNEEVKVACASPAESFAIADADHEPGQPMDTEVPLTR